MWLTRAKLPALASAIVKALVDPTLIEAESREGVQADILAVLEQYLRDEQDISTRARDIAARRTGPPTDLSRVKRDLARQQATQKLGGRLVPMGGRVPTPARRSVASAQLTERARPCAA